MVGHKKRNHFEGTRTDQLNKFLLLRYIIDLMWSLAATINSLTSSRYLKKSKNNRLKI